MLGIRLHITDRPITWFVKYPIVPRIGDRVLHPDSAVSLLKVDSVLIHSLERNALPDGIAADIYCSEVEV